MIRIGRRRLNGRAEMEVDVKAMVEGLCVFCWMVSECGWATSHLTLHPASKDAFLLTFHSTRSASGAFHGHLATLN